VTTGFGLHGAKDVGGAPAFVLAVDTRFAAWFGWGRRPNLGVGNGVLVQANYWRCNIIGPLVGLESVFHIPPRLQVVVWEQNADGLGAQREESSAA